MKMCFGWVLCVILLEFLKHVIKLEGIELFSAQAIGTIVIALCLIEWNKHDTQKH